MRATDNERRDWAVIVFILLFGLFWILVAGGWALRFAPSWELNANVESKLDPNSDYLTNKPKTFFEPVDSAILSDPEWINNALTPGAPHSSNVPLSTATGISTITSTPATVIATLTQTASPVTTAFTTNTATVLASATNTLVYVPPASTTTSKPKPAFTSTPTPTATFTGSVASTATPTSTSAAASTSTSTPTVTASASSTGTMTPSQTSTPTNTATSTSTPTPTSTVTSTATATDTPDPVEPDFGGPDGNAITLGNGASVTFNLSGLLLDGNSAWDLVYYEQEETSAAGKIHLGAVLIEVYDQTTDAWYVVYNWGDGTADTNASYSNNAEPDGFPVDKSLLYGTPPLNTGIAIDVDTPAIVQGGSAGDSITKIRITSLSSNDCDIDSLQMLR